MTFIPFYGKIQVEPAKRDGILQDNGLEERGVVVAVGEGVTFVKPGDTLFFNAHGIWEAQDGEGNKYYTIAEDSEFILGKYVAEE